MWHQNAHVLDMGRGEEPTKSSKSQNRRRLSESPGDNPKILFSTPIQCKTPPSQTF